MLGLMYNILRLDLIMEYYLFTYNIHKLNIIVTGNIIYAMILKKSIRLYINKYIFTSIYICNIINTCMCVLFISPYNVYLRSILNVMAVFVIIPSLYLCMQCIAWIFD